MKALLRVSLFLLAGVSIQLGAVSLAKAQNFVLESAVIDSVSARNLGTARQSGVVSTFFQAQKSMVYDILRSSGVDIERLPPDARRRIEKFQTTNLEAFKAFSQGLDLKDKGRFAEAKAFFQKAIELDPGFKLAEDSKIAMPDLNLVNLLQIRGAIQDSTNATVERSKQQLGVDLARAMAAMLSGQSIALGSGGGSLPNNASASNASLPSSANFSASVSSYTSNPAGSAAQYVPSKVIGMSFNYDASAGFPLGIASTNEWGADKYVQKNGVLESVGSANGFSAQRSGASTCCQSSHVMGDGTSVYWGAWNSTVGASATVSVSGSTLSTPVLGPTVQYMMGDATKQMPTSGSAEFKPVGGFLTAASGSISVNFITRQINLNNLGFSLSGLSFSGLNGSTTYDASIASGFFRGNYTSGSCLGCTTFSPTSSVYMGNFVGSSANGLILANMMQNGPSTVAGTHLFSH